MIKMVFFATLFLLSANTFAATKLISFPTTDYETVETTATGLKIYAGMTDNPGTCSTTPTCNKCAGDNTAITTNRACGQHEVVPSGTISFVIRSDNTTLTSATATAAIRNTSTPGSVIVTSSSTYAANSDLTVSTTWLNLCASAGAANCTGSWTANFDVGFSSDAGSTVTEKITVTILFRYVAEASAPAQSFNCAAPVDGEGFCSFIAYPGDKKAYILPTFNSANTTGVVSNFSGAGSGTDISTIKYKALRVFYVLGTGPADTQAANAAAFTMDMSNYQDLSYTIETNTLTPKFISGLTNQDPTAGNAYVLVTGNLDQAGIVSSFSDPAGGALCAAPFGLATDYFTNTDGTQCVLPQVVSGLLDGQQCFVATATYGSSMAPEVESFRQFRGQYLLTHSWGKEFVRFYYKHSPPIAAVIADNGFLRFVSRVFLLPMLLFVKLTLALGLVPSVIISLLGGSALVYYSRRLWRKEEN
jgi:hypothetical protein